MKSLKKEIYLGSLCREKVEIMPIKKLTSRKDAIKAVSILLKVFKSILTVKWCSTVPLQIEK